MSLVVDIRKKLKDFSLEVSFKTDGDYIGILGASGSGKSMTLKCIAGIETPDEGIIILNDKVLFHSEKKINLKPQQRNVGYLFQNYALFPHITVEENIGIGLSFSKKEKEEKIKKIIEAFHLQGLEKKYPNQLSGGQQQRVALARCIVYKPDVLMLDEPFSALDSHLKEQLQSGVLELLNLYHGEVLLVSHSRDEVYRFSRKLIIFDKGKSVLFGDTKEIFKQPKLRTAATLTGCKNISKCEVLSPHRIRVVHWDIILDTEVIVPESTQYIGIMPHNFQIVHGAKEKGKNNIVECKITNIVEDVFEYNIFFKIKGSRNENHNGDLVYKVSKDKWNNREDKENLYLKIPENSILMLE